MLDALMMIVLVMTVLSDALPVQSGRLMFDWDDLFERESSSSDSSMSLSLENSVLSVLGTSKKHDLFLFSVDIFGEELESPYRVSQETV